jgi:hypothetical protein
MEAGGNEAESAGRKDTDAESCRGREVPDVVRDDRVALRRDSHF